MKLKDFIDFMKGGAGWAHPWVVLPMGKALAKIFQGYPDLEKEVTIRYESEYEQGRGYVYYWAIEEIPYNEVKKFCPQLKEIIPDNCYFHGANEGNGFCFYFRH